MVAVLTSDDGLAAQVRGVVRRRMEEQEDEERRRRGQEQGRWQ